MAVVLSPHPSTTTTPVVPVTPIHLEYEDPWDRWRARRPHRKRAFRRRLEQVTWALVALVVIALAVWETFR